MRTALGILFAPLAGAVVLLGMLLLLGNMSLAALRSRELANENALGVTLVVMYCYLFGWGLGIPILLVQRRFRRVSLRHFVLVGIVSGALVAVLGPVLFFDPDGRFDFWEYLIWIWQYFIRGYLARYGGAFVLTGVGVALTFWLIAVWRNPHYATRTPAGTKM